MQKVKIISDGTPNGTRVLDSDGVQIEGAISKIEWGIEAGGGPAIAKITFINVEVEVIGEADNVR